MKTILATILSCTLLLCLPAQAQRFSDYSVEDKKLLWEEAVASFDGLEYEYVTRTFATENHARDCLKDLSSCISNNSGAPKEAKHRYNEMPRQWREKVASLDFDEVSEPFYFKDADQWLVFELIKKLPSQFVGAIDPLAWLEKFSATSLPSPYELRNDPAVVLRTELNRISSRDGLQQLLSKTKLQARQLDSLLSNGNTLLIKAVYNNDRDMMAALIAAGASVNQCGAASCPLSKAVALNLPDAVTFLLKNKANPNGARSNDTPLIYASTIGNRPVAQMLIDAGADVLKTRNEQAGGFELKRSMLFYALSEFPGYVNWLSDQVNQALEKTGKYQWTAWIEQNNKRTPVQDGSSISIRRAPFKLIMKMNPESSFRVLAFEDPAALEKTRDALLRRQMLMGTRIGASAADSKYLSVFSTLQMEGNEVHFSFTSNEWSYSTEPNQQMGTRRVVNRGQTEYEHDVHELILDGQEVPITKYTGKEISVVMGPIPPLGTGSDYFKPARIKLKFSP
jgi:Ankyrin repeats (3 copies)